MTLPEREGSMIQLVVIQIFLDQTQSCVFAKKTATDSSAGWFSSCSLRKLMFLDSISHGYLVETQCK